MSIFRDDLSKAIADGIDIRYFEDIGCLAVNT